MQVGEPVTVELQADGLHANMITPVSVHGQFSLSVGTIDWMVVWCNMVGKRGP